MEIIALVDILKFIAALVFVLALMIGLAIFIKRVELKGGPVARLQKRRLKIIESLNMDARHRLVLIQRDNQQHLVILSSNGETIVETGIEATQDNAELKNKDLENKKTDILQNETAKAA